MFFITAPYPSVPFPRRGQGKSQCPNLFLPPFGEGYPKDRKGAKKGCRLLTELYDFCKSICMKGNFMMSTYRKPAPPVDVDRQGSCGILSRPRVHMFPTNRSNVPLKSIATSRFTSSSLTLHPAS